MGLDVRIKVAEKIGDLSLEDYLKMEKLLGELGFLATAWGTREFTLGQMKVILTVVGPHLFGKRTADVKIYQDGHVLPTFHVFREVVHLQGSVAEPLHEFIEKRIIGRELESGEIVQLTKADIEKLHSELEEIRERKNADEVFDLKDFTRDDRKWFFQRFYSLLKGVRELLKEDLDNSYVIYEVDW